MLLAEEFVLIALDESGAPARGATNQYGAEIGVTAALITELVLDGHVRLDDGRIRVTGTRPTHPLLAQVLDNVALVDGKKLTSRLTSIRHSGWSEVVDGMVDAGLLGRERTALRPTRHPPSDRAGQQAVLARVRAAAADTGPIDPRTAVLLAFAGPCHLLEVVAPDRAARKQAKRRISEAAEQVPAAAALKYVIDATSTAVVAAASAT